MSKRQSYIFGVNTVQPIWVFYTDIDIYMSWFLRVTYVSAPLSLNKLVSLIHQLGGPFLGPASCSLGPVLPRYPVSLPWSCLAICIYISMALVTSHVWEQRSECALITLVMEDLTLCSCHLASSRFIGTYSCFTLIICFRTNHETYFMKIVI